MCKKLPNFEERRKIIYSHRWKIIIISFLFSLVIFLISLFTSNKGGLFIVICYPISLLGFLHDQRLEYGMSKGLFYPLAFMLFAIFAFVAGFFLP
jgi:hypothetical protein